MDGYKVLDDGTGTVVKVTARLCGTRAPASLRRAGRLELRAGPRGPGPGVEGAGDETTDLPAGQALDVLTLHTAVEVAGGHHQGIDALGRDLLHRLDKLGKPGVATVRKHQADQVGSPAA